MPAKRGVAANDGGLFRESGGDISSFRKTLSTKMNLTFLLVTV